MCAVSMPARQPARGGAGCPAVKATTHILIVNSLRVLQFYFSESLKIQGIGTTGGKSLYMNESNSEYNFLRFNVVR